MLFQKSQASLPIIFARPRLLLDSAHAPQLGRVIVLVVFTEIVVSVVHGFKQSMICFIRKAAHEVGSTPLPTLQHAFAVRRGLHEE
jgi:hypothetical protein